MNEKFKFNALEYSKMLGITLSALRKRRLAGKLTGQYILEKNKYMYASPRPLHGEGTGKCSLSRKRRRSVPRHLTRYPSSKFQLTNDLRQLARINRKLSEAEIAEIVPDIWIVAKEKRQQRITEQLQQLQPSTVKKYSSGIFNAKEAQPNYRKIKYQDEIEDEEKEFWGR